MIHPSQQQQPYSPQRPVTCLAITRGGKTRVYKIRPWVAGAAFSAVALFTSAYVAATAYLVYRDDLLGGAVARQVAMQYAYEDRVEALRSEIDRIASKHVLEAHGVEEQLALLLERQEAIQQRQSALDQLVNRARETGIQVAELPPAPRPRPQPGLAGPDAGASELLAFAPAQEHRRDVISGTLIRTPASDAPGAARAEMKPILFSTKSSLNDIDARQSDLLDVLTAEARNEADKISSALAPLGLEKPVLKPRAPQGGPFIPAGTMHFVERTALLSRTLDEIASLRRSAQAMPLAPPVRGASISSRFGYRDDPFLHRPAMHAGLDFIAPEGTDVRATGAGVVVSAGWNGGYGQMVAIEHAAGMSTRYAHLSAIQVRPGTQVAEGDIIGRVGSTGRSTGPHLHYETRRNGEPVNPSLYLAAGRAL